MVKFGKVVLFALAWLAWVAFCFFASQAVVVFLVGVLQIPVATGDALTNTTLNALVYGLMLILAAGIPWALRGSLGIDGKLSELVAITRKIKWADLGQAIFNALSYFGVLVVIMLAFAWFFPDLANQDQDLGYSRFGNNWWQLSLMFIALVVIAPVCEELIMRGLLFGRLRAKLSFWPTTILVSALFAVAHGQINVGIDVFILSLFLCHAREKSGAIWSPILIHMIKNLIGFLAVFIWML
jgi:membrane protease YdiL (CAAX protease family)